MTPPMRKTETILMNPQRLFYRFWTSFILLATIGIGCQLVVLGKNYVEITRNRVNIRSRPTTSASVIVRAELGDIFEMDEEQEGWYKIHLFSGDWRYLHASVAKEVRYVSETPEDSSLRRKFFQAWQEIKIKIQQEADNRHSPQDDLQQNIEFSRRLEDRYKLELIHKFNFQPPVYRRIAIEGFQKGW